jgi:CRP-like cAMP-binding protein
MKSGIDQPPPNVEVSQAMPEARHNSEVRNRLLLALPHQELENLLPNLEPVHLPKGKIIYHAGEILRHGYFINDGQVSLLSLTEEGTTIEVAMVGNEGAIGIPIVWRTNKTPYQVMVQIPVKSAFRIKAAVFRNEFDRGGKFQDLMLRYTEVLFTQITQSAVCNHFHSSVQRLARWLLIANDLVGTPTFHLTHEFISHMLGAPRTGVTMAAGVLQKSGLLSYSRGRITILNRPGLESTSCECYNIIRESFDHFLDAEEGNVDHM